ncbi:MAG: alpha/beta fold hydrolase [Planctomycetota bacterium]
MPDPQTPPTKPGATQRMPGGRSRQRDAERAPLDLADSRRRMRAKLAPEYDFTPHFVRSVDGPWMHFVDKGNPAAEPILCVHGNPSWSFHFRKLVDRFADTHRVIAPDLVGCGFSEKPADFDYRLERHVATLEGFVDELGLDQITLVVQDWGGAIGLGFATRRPDLVERLVILNSGAFRSAAMPPRIALARLPLLGRLGVRGLGLFSRLALSWAVERKRWSKLEKRGYLLPYKGWSQRVAIDAFVLDIPMRPGHPSYDELVRIEEALPSLAHKPTALVWGERDWCFTTAFRDRYREFFPQAESVGLPDAGHWVLEDASDEVLDAIAGFLERHPLPAPVE